MAEQASEGGREGEREREKGKEQKGFLDFEPRVPPDASHGSCSVHE